MFALIHRENVEERSLPLPLLNMLLSDLKNTLFKARFQVLPPQSEEMSAKLKKLDERLYSPTPTFAQLEDDALACASSSSRCRRHPRRFPMLSAICRRITPTPACA